MIRFALVGLCVWLCAFAGSAHAEDNSEIIIVPGGWQRVEVDAPPGTLPAPTFKYVPEDHRNAALLITILGRGDGRIADRATLDAFHRVMCKRFLSNGQDAIKQNEFSFANGIGVFATFEDPNLVGKTSTPGDYKVASPVALLLTDGMVVQATIFTEEKADETFDQALNSLETIDLPAAPESALTKRKESGKTLIGMQNLAAELVFPVELAEGDVKLNRSTSYFSFVAKSGALLSGWLEPADKYSGFRTTWRTEKAKIETGTGLRCEDETFATIDGWEVVEYTLNLNKKSVQQNLRACKVLGNTWADLHLSITQKQADRAALESLLRSTSLQLKK